MFHAAPRNQICYSAFRRKPENEISYQHESSLSVELRSLRIRTPFPTVKTATGQIRST